MWHHKGHKLGESTEYGKGHERGLHEGHNGIQQEYRRGINRGYTLGMQQILDKYIRRYIEYVRENKDMTKLVKKLIKVHGNSHIKQNPPLQIQMLVLITIMQITRTRVSEPPGNLIFLSAHFDLLRPGHNYPHFQKMVREQIAEAFGEQEIEWPEYSNDGYENGEDKNENLIGTINTFFASHKK